MTTRGCAGACSQFSGRLWSELALVLTFMMNFVQDTQRLTIFDDFRRTDSCLGKIIRKLARVYKISGSKINHSREGKCPYLQHIMYPSLYTRLFYPFAKKWILRSIVIKSTRRYDGLKRQKYINGDDLRN